MIIATMGFLWQCLAPAPARKFLGAPKHSDKCYNCKLHKLPNAGVMKIWGSSKKVSTPA